MCLKLKSCIKYKQVSYNRCDKDLLRLPLLWKQSKEGALQAPCMAITSHLEAAMRKQASHTSCLLQHFHGMLRDGTYPHPPSIMSTQRNCLFYSVEDCRVSYRSPKSLLVFLRIYFFIFLFIFPDSRIVCGHQDTAVATA